jgi:hypothetical protein
MSKRDGEWGKINWQVPSDDFDPATGLQFTESLVRHALRTGYSWRNAICPLKTGRLELSEK